MIPADHSILLMRFSEQRWINSLINGTVSFSCTGAFIEQAKKDTNSTQADAFEGYFARLHKSDPRINQMRIRFKDDLEEEWSGDYVLLRRYSSKLIPIFCVYAYTAKDALNAAKYGGSVKIEHEFDNRMFTDFGIGWGLNVVDDDHRLAMITMQVEPFKNNVLINCSRQRLKCISSYVSYDLDENDTFFIEPTAHYDELSHKRKQYSFQHEARFWLPEIRLESFKARKNLGIDRLSPSDYWVANEPLKMVLRAKLKRTKQKK